MRRPTRIAPAKGKLGILTPGMGAVSTTFMAGVELVRRGLSNPVGSLACNLARFDWENGRRGAVR